MVFGPDEYPVEIRRDKNAYMDFGKYRKYHHLRGADRRGGSHHRQYDPQ